MTRIADLLDIDFSAPIEAPPEQTVLSPAGIREAVARQVLRKKGNHEQILRNLFREFGPTLVENLRLEGSTRVTEFDEEQFVRFYPHVPHLIDLSVDILAGIRRARYVDGQTRGDGILRQTFEMLVSDRTRLIDQPVGVLVSIDRIYELVKGNIAAKKQRDVLDIRDRFAWDQDYPRMAGRVAKAICLMEFVQGDLPRTTKNIAALLIQRVNDAPPVLAVAAILHHLNQAGLVRETADGWRLCDTHELHRIAADLARLRDDVGAVNPRPSGWHNGTLQFAKKSLARVLGWYTRPSREFNAAVTRSLEELVSAVDRVSANLAEQSSRTADTLERLSMNVAALEGRMALLDKRSPTRPPVRTAYVIGLFGTGRRYINELLLQNLGEREKYFRDTIRLHPGPTPMIYSGHATIRHPSRAQELPGVMCSILEAVRAQFADLIFVYRHPLDSLLTNWVWWRSYLHHNRLISGISDVYPHIDDLCAELDRDFDDFRCFADGDPEFFAAEPGSPFLSFAEYVEETELHLRAAPLALRLEDFMVDPTREFAKLAKIISHEVEPTNIAPPKSKPYGHLAVRDKVPRFREFMDGLDSETRSRIERIGYSLGQ